MSRDPATTPLPLPSLFRLEEHFQEPQCCRPHYQHTCCRSSWFSFFSNFNEVSRTPFWGLLKECWRFLKLKGIEHLVPSAKGPRAQIPGLRNYYCKDKLVPYWTNPNLPKPRQVVKCVDPFHHPRVFPHCSHPETRLFRKSGVMGDMNKNGWYGQLPCTSRPLCCCWRGAGRTNPLW